MICIILGTRPEIIKCAPVIHEALKRGVPLTIVHTGQHYTPELDELFFTELDLPQPEYNIHVGSLPPAKQIGSMLNGLSDVLSELKPKVVLVQGDTNTVLAGALTAHKMGIKVAHLEAGLRSDDWEMPEEGNRVLAGMVADYHFCPTEVQRTRLAQESITDGIHVVGNTIVDASRFYVERAKKNSKVLESVGVVPRQYVLLTMHRPSNVDSEVRLTEMMSCLDAAAAELGLKIIFPVHPRTETSLKRADLWEKYQRSTSFVFINPIGYLDMLALQSSAALIFTDSGGVQEEANILQVPCITLRTNTERPETISAGGNVLFAGSDYNDLVSLARLMMAKEKNWDCPFGDGKTAQRVIDILNLD